MIAPLVDILKVERGEVRKHALFVGSGFPLQPMRRTTKELLGEAAIRWAIERELLRPHEVDESAAAVQRALARLAGDVPDNIERCRIVRGYFEECRPSEGHIRLAGLIREQYFSTIFTTSIDGLLEQTLEQQRLLAGREYILCVVPTTTADEIRLALEESSRVVIVKLLGDINSRVLPLTRDECLANLRRVADIIEEQSAKTCILANIGERDRPLLRFVSSTGGRLFWVSERVPVGDREAFDDLKLDSPDSVGFHEYLPRAVKLLSERGCRENVLCRELGSFDAFFAQLHTRLVRRRHRHRSMQKKMDITLLPGGPYRFLEHFDTKHADLFFGRERDTDALCDMVEHQRLVVLFGASGMGKTSLLKAGLMAAVQGQDEQERAEYLPIYVRGLDDPSQSLKATVADAVDQYGAAVDPHLLECPVALLIDRAAAVLPKPVLIILDQFEEHFVRLGQPARDSFLDELSNAIAGCDPSVRFVIAVREDFLGELFQLRSRIPQIFDNMYRLSRLRRDEAESAITKPAAHFDIHVDPALADRIVDDLYKEGVEPPQLQIVCDRLYGVLSEGQHFMGMKLYEQEGRAQTILDNWVRKVLSRLARRERVAARNILKLLITAHETQASLSLEEMAAERADGVEFTARVIAHLVDLRMIREVEAAPGTFELVHEYVAHAIRDWISERELRIKDVQDLLGRQLNSWRKFGILMHSDELNLVHEYRDSVPMSRDELALVIRSASAHSFELDYWRGRLEELRERQFPLLRDMLHDHASAVRRIAVEALAQLDDRRALPLLVDALDEESPEVRAETEAGLKENERQLIEALKDSSAKVRDGAARALGRIGSQRGARELLARLEDGDAGVRRAAVQALQSLPDARLTGSLIRLLSAGPASSWSAAEVLGAVGSDPDVFAALGSSSDVESSAQAHYVLARVHLSARRLEEAGAELTQAEAACRDEEGARLIAAARGDLAKAQQHRGDAAPAWDMFHKDSSRSGASAETVAPPLEEAWRYRAADFVASSPAVVNELVYIGARDGRVYCLELPTGVLRWRFKTQDRVESSPAINGNILYVGSHDGRVYALDARSGAQIWTSNLKRPVRASCNFVDDLVVVGCWDGAVYGLDAQDGRQRWRFDTEGEVYSSACVADHTAFVGSWDGRLYAIDCEDGTKRWDYATGGEISSSPAIAADGDVVIVGSDDGAVYALGTRSPELLWRYETKGAVRSSPAVADGAVYVGSLDGGLYALQLADGKLRWVYMTGEEIVSSAAVAGDFVFVGSRDGALYALSADKGERMWQQSTSYGIVSSPGVCEGHVVVGMEYYYICAFRSREAK